MPYQKVLKLSENPAKGRLSSALSVLRDLILLLRLAVYHFEVVCFSSFFLPAKSFPFFSVDLWTQSWVWLSHSLFRKSVLPSVLSPNAGIWQIRRGPQIHKAYWCCKIWSGILLKGWRFKPYLKWNLRWGSVCQIWEISGGEVNNDKGKRWPHQAGREGFLMMRTELQVCL